MDRVYQSHPVASGRRRQPSGMRAHFPRWRSAAGCAQGVRIECGRYRNVGAGRRSHRDGNLRSSDAARGVGELRLRFELGIPVEIVEPAFMQIIGRKKPPISMQIEHCRPRRLVRRKHSGDLRHHPALLEIAWRTGGDHVVPTRLPAARARNKMIERQIALVAAILASEAIAQKHVEARERRIERRLYIRFE